jgi:hypothetical protein
LISRFLFGCAAVVLLLSGAPLALELFRVDACLDRGGSYDYASARCDFQATHTPQPLLQRHRLSLGVGLPGAAVLSGLALLARARNRRPAA